MRCDVCPHECELEMGEVGKCNVRMAFREGVGLANYGQVTTAIAGPIEQKPLFHFMPGLRVLSIGGSGCNMSCSYCQNFEVSQASQKGEIMLPADVVRLAKEKGCGGVAFTYAEPVVMYEYVMAVAYAARVAGLATIMKTNGYANPRAFDNLCRMMDAVNVDIKGTDEDYVGICGAPSATRVLRETLGIARAHCHVEMSFLPIPPRRANEVAAMLSMAKLRAGEAAPIHVLRFVPDFKMRGSEPASMEYVDEMARMAEAIGFKYVYRWFPGASNATKCSWCHTDLVSREGTEVTYNALAGGRFCPRCGKNPGFGIIPACSTTTSAATPSAVSSLR